MRLEYISHSCFVIHTKGKKLVFDPWITGSAYRNQWHLFPKPVSTRNVEDADAVLISHGHEDHLHGASLKMISRNAHVFFPFQWRKGAVDYFRHLGFAVVTEAVGFRSYSFEHVTITYLGYALESVIVVECEGQVIVNINDALNSNHETATNFLLKKIKARWKKIDYLLSGWSGAGYFPNKVKYNGKDDKEVGMIREQYFADNFCKFTHFLQPRIAVPFAPGFVLLAHENRWINHIKFSRQEVIRYYQEHFEAAGEIVFPIFYPGDYIEDDVFHPVSHYHALGDHRLYERIDEEFREEIISMNTVKWFPEEHLHLLKSKLKIWLNRNKVLYARNVIDDAVFSVQLKDIPYVCYFNIRPDNGNLHVELSSQQQKDDRLLITTKAELLSVNLDKPWGGDLLSIGYGAEVEVYEELSLEKNLDIVCMRLISRFPMFHEDFKQHTGRIVRYYLGNPALTNLWIYQKIRLRPYVNKYPFNERDHWITYNKCDLCKVCRIPELDFAHNRP
jgi:hypothetical protein